MGVKHYVAASDPGWLAQSPFVPTTERLRADPGWTLVEPPVTHNALATGPETVVRILEDVAREVARRP